MSDAPIQVRHTAKQWLDTVKALERDLEFFKAFDLAQQGLAAYPDDVWLKHRAVLCLAKTGATELAQQKYRAFGLAKFAEQHDDIAALDARLLKDEALAAAGPERKQKAALAADRYAQIHARSHHYYPAINAATLRLVSGDERAAKRLAQIVLREIGGGEDHDYYSYATRIEALFLLGQNEAARALFADAIRANGGDNAALATTWRQLRLVLELKNLDPKVEARDFMPPRVIHFVGHMIAAHGKPGRFEAPEEPAVTGRIEDYFKTHRIGAGYGSLASGADILFAEALLRHGAGLHVMMPFELEEFVEMSVRPAGGTWVRRFERCLAAAQTVRWATEDQYLGDDHLFTYSSRVAMGLAVLRARQLGSEVEQVAVWDGRPPSGIAGTAVDLAAWRRTGLAQTAIPCGDYDGAGSDIFRANAPSDPGRDIRAMLFCDIKGFSKLNDAELPHFVDGLLGEVATVVDSYGVAVDFANTWGDGLFLVFDDAGEAARCALDLQVAVSRIDLVKIGLPSHIAMRIGGHLGPVFSATDPVLKRNNYFGAHVSRAARIEPVTPEGCVYVTETFAAVLGFEHGDEFVCDYVGMTEAAKHYGAMPMFLLRRHAAH